MAHPVEYRSFIPKRGYTLNGVYYRPRFFVYPKLTPFVYQDKITTWPKKTIYICAYVQYLLKSAMLYHVEGVQNANKDAQTRGYLGYNRRKKGMQAVFLSHSPIQTKLFQ